MKTKKNKFLDFAGALLIGIAALFFVTGITGCPTEKDPGTGKVPQTVEYTGIDTAGIAYTLTITENTSRYTAAAGDSYVLAIEKTGEDDKVSKGAVSDAGAGALTLKPNNGDSFSVTVSDEQITAITGPITVDGGSTVTAGSFTTGGGGINYAGPADLTGKDFDSTWYTPGKLVSKGASTTATTYYIDYAKGDDSKSGTSVANAWKTFKNANGRTFQPGDHILLEANSIWNGESVTPANNAALSANWAANDRVAMLAPRGSGTAGKPIVIDFYVNDNGTAKFESNKRPIINGNGTPSVGSYAYWMTGAITIFDEEQWEIYNIEVTNSFDFPKLAADPALRKTHWDSNTVIKRLAAIIVIMAGGKSGKHAVIKDCYAHDVQSEKPTTPTSGSHWNVFGQDTVNSSRRDKVAGGIYVTGIGVDPNGTARAGSSSDSFGDVLIESNIIKRVSMCAFRNGSPGSGNADKIIFRGNYVETCGGDGFVLTRATGTGENQSKAEYNILKDTCNNSYNTNLNYAAGWNIYLIDGVQQYNECYGTMYGYQDSEAWDFDGGSVRSVIQYSYSHYNAGGACLFMSAGQQDSVFRFNISANDGIGARGVAGVTNEGNSDVRVNTEAGSFTAFPGGQSIFHYAAGSPSVASTAIPLIYNNTFYIGDGYTVGLAGQNNSNANNYYLRFYNNIIIKAGEGRIELARGHGNPPNGNGSVINPSHFKNNILWGYSDPAKPTTGDRSKFFNGNNPNFNTLMSQSGSKWVNPQLKIQKAKNVDILLSHRGAVFEDTFVNDPAALAAFTGKERLRRRASIFAPINANSPAIRKDADGKMPGMVIPVGTNATIDNAWHGGNDAEAFRAKEDFFGTAIAADNWPIGAAAAPYTPPRP